MQDAAPGNGRRFIVPVSVEPKTGQLLGLGLSPGSRPLQFHPGPELTINGLPLVSQCLGTDEAPSEHVTTLEAHHTAAYGAGVRLEVRRFLTLGGIGTHSGPIQSLHMRYEIRRLPNTVAGDKMDYIWQPELESPFTIDSIGVMPATTEFLGPDTRMRALAIGGSGPREHVSYEDGPVEDVVKSLNTGFRSTFPGQPTINGVLLYNTDDQRYVWVVVRRPFTGGRLEFDAEHLSIRFHYFQPMPVQQEIMTPAISFFWGQGLDEAERVLADQFDEYEEPPEWWYHTSWFWMHPSWQRGGSFAAMGAAADVLHEKCGVNGFGLFAHEVPWSGNDVDMLSPRLSPTLGGDRAMKKVLRRFRERNIHSFIWISQKGHRPDGPGYEPNWAIVGTDGRPVRLHNRAEWGVRLDIIDPADPTFLQYICHWVHHYVVELGITGLFWDSAFQPVPPDFGDKPYLRWPGQSMAAMLEFYRKVYAFGRSLSPDFFMWGEGINTDVTMNAFAVDSRDPACTGGHGLMHRIANRGRQRLVWRSAWSHDVSGAFPFISPTNDVGMPTDIAGYAKIAADPMNQWLCRTVRERGTRQAHGLGLGVSRLDEFVIVSPGAKEQQVTLDEPNVRLDPLAGGRPVQVVGSTAQLSVPGAYRIETVSPTIVTPTRKTTAATSVK